MMKDDDVVYGVKTREPGASEYFYQTYAPVIYRVALAILSHEELARDCVQDVLVRILRSIHTYNGRASLKTWIVTIAVNTGRTALKKKRKFLKRHTSLENLVIAGREESPEQSVIRGERREFLLRFIQRLSPVHRETLILRETEQLSYEEISAVLNVPVGTVRSRLARARMELAALYAKEMHREHM